FLEARQDGEIALINHRTAELLHVAVTGLLLLRCSAPRWLRLLGEGSGRSRERQQGECEERFAHRIPSFRQQESSSPICTSASPERICLDGQAPRNAATSTGQ